MFRSVLFLFIILPLVLSLGLFVSWLAASNVYDSEKDVKKEFKTDGCTLFPDLSWRSCCEKHDFLYWSGGSERDKLEADLELKSCIKHASGSELLAGLVFLGVRAGGTPYLPTYWRWGFGWSYGRGYTK